MVFYKFIHLSLNVKYQYEHKLLVKQHGIIVVTIHSDTANGKRVKCPFRLRSLSNGSGWKVVVRCELQNHKPSKDLEGHDILGRLKDHERRYVNDMIKYNMSPRYIVATLKDKDPGNLTSVIQVYKARATYSANNIGSLMEMQMLLSLIHR
ncbi:uncharacterized protein LOC127115324 [Lathyrus oleraceus]|uniref:uncharacterized protein LOC127115324 n=1 Tax=Pisum sativum TaxID=3888 RepID=UPI0021D3B8FA|nr:uncharacterized protein LOC127115324 [Pisum sativum]